MPANSLALLMNWQVVAQINEQTADDRSSYDALFDVPYATLSVGTIQGGTATNIVPNLCEFTFDYRNLPSMTTDAILTPIHAKIEALSEQMQAVDEVLSKLRSWKTCQR